MPDTRVEFLETIEACIDNEDGEYEETRVFLLIGPAGSGKSTLAHSIAFHYDQKGLLFSSFFFSVDKKENSRAHRLFRNVAKDIAGKNSGVRRRLYEAVKGDEGLCTTESIKHQYENFLQKALEGVDIEGYVVVVIDALDECSGSGNGEDMKILQDILAEGLIGLPHNVRVFLTARAGTLDQDVENSKYIKIFRTEDAPSKFNDIQTLFHYKLSNISIEFEDLHWLLKLVELANYLFIYAAVACEYILKKEFRTRKQRYQNLLRLGGQSDRNTPNAYLYKLYKEVLDNTINRPNLAPEDVKSVQESLGNLLGTVALTYEPLSIDALNELLVSDDDVKWKLGQLGTLLNGASRVDTPVQLLHASLLNFLQDKEFSEAYYVDSQKQHGMIAKSCLELMNNCLKFNFFNISEDDILMSSDDKEIHDFKGERRNITSDAVRYAL